jgi:hypothetical protein
MVRMSDGKTGWVPPMPEERERALEALERLRRWREQILAERGGRYFTSAAEVIRELRDERDREFDALLDARAVPMTQPADSTVPDLPPLSPEERRRMLAAVERSRRRHAELLAARGGQLFPDSVNDIAELRAERERELS